MIPSRESLEIFHEIVKNNNSCNTTKGFYLNVAEKEKDTISEIGISFTEAYEDDYNITINRDQEEYLLFLNIKAFNNYIVNTGLAKTLDKEFVVLEMEKANLFHYDKNQTDFPKNIEDVIYYSKLKTLFREKISDANDGKNIYHLFTTDKGPFTLRSKSEIPALSDDSFIKDIYLRTKEIVDYSDTVKKKIFKNIIINTIPRSDSENFSIFLKKASSIFLDTENDFDHYLKRFTFENLDNEAKRSASNHFNKINETLSKTIMQVIGIPVSISATLIALEKVSNEYKILVALLFLIYSLFSLRFVSMFLIEFNHYKETLEEEINSAIKASALGEKYIKKITTKVTRKSTLSVWIVRVLYFFFLTLILISLLYILYYYFCI